MEGFPVGVLLNLVLRGHSDEEICKMIDTRCDVALRLCRKAIKISDNKYLSKKETGPSVVFSSDFVIPVASDEAVKEWIK